MVEGEVEIHCALCTKCIADSAYKARAATLIFNISMRPRDPSLKFGLPTALGVTNCLPGDSNEAMMISYLRQEHCI